MSETEIESLKESIPSADYIIAISSLLETDADDILHEFGYVEEPSPA